MSDKKTYMANAFDLVLSKLNYEFINTDLLLEAITHKSISKINYERLEFLGDAVIQLIITEYLFKKYPNHQEGDLSREKQVVVSKKILSSISINIGLINVLRSNNLKFESNDSLKESLSTDIIESIIGAIFLDSDYVQCQKIVLEIFSEHLDGIETIGQKDPKTLLQEYMQSIGQPLPIYSTTKISGPSHDPMFKITCRLKIYKNSESVTSKTVQSGQQEVSEVFLKKIKNEKKI
jgi:ribonuclease III